MVRNGIIGCSGGTVVERIPQTHPTYAADPGSWPEVLFCMSRPPLSPMIPCLSTFE